MAMNTKAGFAVFVRKKLNGLIRNKSLVKAAINGKTINYKEIYLIVPW